MPMIGIKSKGSENDAAVINVTRVERSARAICLYCDTLYIGYIYLSEAEIDDDLAELLRVYDAAQAKEK